MRERVSVVIPVRDGERYLAEAIESALGQTVAPAEVIVVDDASQDRSAALAEGYGPAVTLLSRATGVGAPAARNLGVAASTGEFVAFLDADDRWRPDRLARQLEALTAENPPALVFGHVEEFHSPELTLEQRRRLPAPRGLVPGRTLITLLTARATLDRVGPFDETLAAADVLDWLARARALGLRELMLDDVLADRRVHLHNTQWTSRPQDLLRALRRAVPPR